MNSGAFRSATLIALSAALFLWPWWSPDSVMRWLADQLSAGSFVTLWGASAFAGVWITLNVVLSHLRKSGRGLAGKSWGPLAPGAWLLPVLLAFIVAFAIGWHAGIGGPWVLPALLICLALLGYYVRILGSIDRRRRVLRGRGVESLSQETRTANFREADVHRAVGVAPWIGWAAGC